MAKKRTGRKTPKGRSVYVGRYRRANNREMPRSKTAGGKAVRKLIQRRVDRNRKRDSKGRFV